MKRIHVIMSIYHFQIWRSLFGFQNANRLLISINKQAVIPILRNNGASIDANCDIESPLIIHNCDNYRNLVVGPDCHIGKNVFLDLKHRVILEASCTISMGTTIVTHIDVGKSDLQVLGFRKKGGGVLFKKGCYIGANVTILHGVTIGSRAIVGAGSVVTRSVSPLTVVGGVPAQYIRKIRR
ncbi:MAG: acyltransferase [candidate division WOR-3 bacterium]|nr:MAG: acyltransferase [candidate division WOR-3 bacterium]